MKYIGRKKNISTVKKRLNYLFSKNWLCFKLHNEAQVLTFFFPEEVAKEDIQWSPQKWKNNNFIKGFWLFILVNTIIFKCHWLSHVIITWCGSQGFNCILLVFLVSWGQALCSQNVTFHINGGDKWGKG